MVEKGNKLKKTAQGGKSILASKILSPVQKEAIQNAGFSFTEYDAININFRNVPFPHGFQHLIFSSKNGVKAFLEISCETVGETEKKDISCYCVGKKTALLLEENGFKVKTCKSNSVALAQFLISQHPHYTFLYCCGNRRRDELPDLFNNNKVKWRELVVYETQLNPVHVDGSFDGILFFSPSEVESFFRSNVLNEATAGCIGPTTARAVHQYTDRFIISPQPDTDSLITLMLNTLKSAAQHPK